MGYGEEKGKMEEGDALIVVSARPSGNDAAAATEIIQEAAATVGVCRVLLPLSLIMHDDCPFGSGAATVFAPIACR